eukprot:TRINITY_DN1253_c0_g1_i1.p1 TRINITY_DN1253_c0_g1~~TRINITY_DN1253_c0_g1_i1.p1  ORF type:complete len:105 (+),score=29.34 TRINITY_DN1253_c0_g1_i1:38-352(+)
MNSSAFIARRAAGFLSKRRLPTRDGIDPLPESYTNKVNYTIEDPILRKLHQDNKALWGHHYMEPGQSFFFYNTRPGLAFTFGWLACVPSIAAPTYNIIYQNSRA